MADDDEKPIIIKKINKIEGGHHGGAWKVAYADFVTAMMAFFLLLWLLNSTSDEQKDGISSYFSPSVEQSISMSGAGAGGIMGGLSLSAEGSRLSNTIEMNANKIPNTESVGEESGDPAQGGNRVTEEKAKDDSNAQKPDYEKDSVQKDTGEDQTSPVDNEAGKSTELSDEEIEEARLKEEMRKLEEKRFEAAMDALKQAINDVPELKDLADNLIIDMTPEGLRIQVVDQEGKSMFPKGSAFMYDKTKTLMDMVTKAVLKLPNQVSIRGHTDSAAYRSGAGYTNWELSVDRANASRRALLEAGMPASRIHNVVGKADTEHFIKEDPLNPRNRRISIILLRDELVQKQGTDLQ